MDYIERLPPIYKASQPKSPSQKSALTELRIKNRRRANELSAYAASQFFSTPAPTSIQVQQAIANNKDLKATQDEAAATTATMYSRLALGRAVAQAETEEALFEQFTLATVQPDELSLYLEEQRLDYIKEGMMSSSDPATLAKTDLGRDIELTKFMVACDFSNNTEPPYSDCTITLKVPSQLVPYLFHGRLKDVKTASSDVDRMQANRTRARRVPSQEGSDRDPISMTSGFRHIQTGGWMSLRIPVDVSGSGASTPTKQHTGDNTRAVFFGVIHTMSVNTSMQATGIFDTTVTLKCYSFIYPFTVAQYRTTPMRVGEMTKINAVALAVSGTGDVDQNPHVVHFDQFIRQRRSTYTQTQKDRAARAGLPDPSANPDERPIGEVLRYMIEALGYFHLPNSLAGVGRMEGIGEVPKMLGQHIMVVGDNVDNMGLTPLSRNFDVTDIIKGTPRPKFMNNSMKDPGGSVTLWQEIRTIVQPPKFQRIIELFPILLPIEASTIYERGDTEVAIPATSRDPRTGEVRPAAAARSSGGPTDLDSRRPATGEDAYQKIRRSELVRNLGAIPCLVYRWRPLPPGFDLVSDKIASHNHEIAGFEEISGYEKIFGTQYFGKPTDIFGPDDSEEMQIEIGTSSAWVNINPENVISQEITWMEHTRVNAVHCYPYFTADGMESSTQPFGVLSVPLFNPQDINRHGMRMESLQTPFYRQAIAQIGSGNTAEIAASAIAERFYYSFGDGHAYGSGTISLVYSPFPDLVCGQWIKIPYDSLQGGRDGRTEQVALTAYCTAVRQQIVIDQQTGRPEAMTVLAVERASYGNRIPLVKHNAVTVQRPRQRTPAAERTSTRRSTRRSRRRR
jgi:hypothetical protein